MPNYLTLNDLAKRWGVTTNALRVRKHRGQLPEPEKDVPGWSPVWTLETIEQYEKDSNGSDETD